MPCGLVQIIAFAAWVLVPPLIPARAYRRDLLGRGEAAGFLPVWHPRLLLGGVLWMRSDRRKLPSRSPPKRLLRNGRLVDVQERLRLISGLEIRFWGASALFFVLLVATFTLCRDAT